MYIFKELLIARHKGGIPSRRNEHRYTMLQFMLLLFLVQMKRPHKLIKIYGKGSFQWVFHYANRHVHRYLLSLAILGVYIVIYCHPDCQCRFFLFRSCKKSIIPVLGDTFHGQQLLYKLNHDLLINQNLKYLPP